MLHHIMDVNIKNFHIVVYVAIAAQVSKGLSKVTTTLQIANYINEIDITPPSTLRAARRVVLDTLGVAVAGSTTFAGTAAYIAAQHSWGHGTASVWFSHTKLTPPGAAFVNSVYASALDLDDGHRGASGHPAAAILPAILAAAEGQQYSGARILSAISIGYEVGTRVAAARDINSLRTVDTGRWCGYGVAAAVAWLHGASADVIAHAISIAGHTGSSQTATGHTKLGHAVKEGIPIATATGMKSFYLARAGYTGPLDILDDESRFNQKRLMHKFAEDWQIQRGYFKLYSACRWAHAPIDGALLLQSTYGITHCEIDSIEVGLFGRALTLTNKVSPENIEEAQYSIQYCVALALIEGREALLPITEEHLTSAAVTDLARKVHLSHRPALDGAFPSATPAHVVMCLKDGRRFEIAIPIPKGEPATPVTDDELISKFHQLAATLKSETRERVCDMILGGTDEIPFDQIYSVLNPPR